MNVDGKGWLQPLTDFSFVDIQPLTYERGIGMQTVTISKSNLIEILNDNRKKHLKEYSEAVIEFRKAARVKVDEMLASLKPVDDTIETDKPLKSLVISLEAPESHLKDYDKALRMLDLSVDENITLSSAEFSQYVDDAWNWKSKLFTLNNTYSGTLFGRDRIGHTVPDVG